MSTKFDEWVHEYEGKRDYESGVFEKTNNYPLKEEAKKYYAINDPTFKNAAGCTDSYPLTIGNENKLLNNKYSTLMNAEFDRGLRNMGNTSHNGVPEYRLIDNNEPLDAVPRLVHEGFSNIRNGVESMPDVSGGVRINDPTEDLLDIDSRPLTDFVHNNMVPFYGAQVTQNMAGTGVESGNYIDGVDVDNGFDSSTPYQQKLSLFTGLDDVYLHKREAGPMFSPAEQQTSWAATRGTPNFRPDMDRYKQGLYIRNDMKPIETQLVGKGLALDPEVPASGGFNEMTRIMPNNVDNYKANQLPGRVVGDKFQLGGEEPTARPGIGLSGGFHSKNIPGVVKHRPNSFWSQARRPTMTTKVGFGEGDFIRPDYRETFKPGNSRRSQAQWGFGELKKIN